MMVMMTMMMMVMMIAFPGNNSYTLLIKYINRLLSWCLGPEFMPYILFIRKAVEY